MRIIRVFPRRTRATPSDDMVVINRPPDLFDTDRAGEIHVSVTFDWDKPRAEELAREWEEVAPVKVGGPAYGDPGTEFEPGMYLKEGYIITSRGCPNSCWFCRAWRNEGREVRELKIKNGWNVLDNNLLATSQEHQEAVFAMLRRQPHRAMFTGGLEAAKMTDWHVEQLAGLKPTTAVFAYDEPRDYEPLLNATRLLEDAGLVGPHKKHTFRVYVLIGYAGDTFEEAEKRLRQVIDLHMMPMAMLLDRGSAQENVKEWRRFQREWTRPLMVAQKMKRP